jgi:hypothetical protein
MQIEIISFRAKEGGKLGTRNKEQGSRNKVQGVQEVQKVQKVRSST